jgi:hypothetical protein
MKELQIHLAVADHLRKRGIKGLVWFHVANGGFRNKREAAVFKKMGLTAGVSDFILFYNSRLFCLELKAPGGRPSEAQLAFLGHIERAGAFTAMPTGLDAALATLEAWGLIKPALKSIGDVLQRAKERDELTRGAA